MKYEKSQLDIISVIYDLQYPVIPPFSGTERYIVRNKGRKV